MREPCIVLGCDRLSVAKGLCDGHYQRWRKGGKFRPEIPLTKSRPGKLNSNWKGGLVDDGRGRMLVYAPKHPFPSWNGTHVYRYRLVLERFLGRFLQPGEIVHHKNGCVNDDRIENLEIMTQAEHAALHYSERSKENGRFK